MGNVVREVHRRDADTIADQFIPSPTNAVMQIALPVIAPTVNYQVQQYVGFWLAWDTRLDLGESKMSPRWTREISDHNVRRRQHEFWVLLSRTSSE